jgi:hypothetical protein
MARTKVKKVAFTKTSGLKQDGTPNASWVKFIDRMSLHKALPLAEWRADQLLGYIFSRYEDHYGLKWALSFSGPPSKCSETFCIQRTCNNLGTNDISFVKNYVDWIFDTILIPKKVNLKSLGYFFTSSLCIEYRTTLLKSYKLSKAKELPSKLLEKAKEFEVSINTYGDLAFAKLAVDQFSKDEVPEDYLPYKNLFNWLDKERFDYSVLSRLE